MSLLMRFAKERGKDVKLAFSMLRECLRSNEIPPGQLLLRE